ncbi:MAG: DegT/DnrJ/EryC1/StrS family aminotransferase [Candidatus Cloacimonetes bacterium]|nr:DegT/DnrJ/EryC1/StrS family aminotransferase [Candidatus Cloacimonadota bacterium]
MIPVYRPYTDGKEIEYLKEVINSGWWGLGPKTKEFEKKFAKYIGSEHAVGLNSATAALHLALKCIEVEGFEVITPSMTFVTTNHAVLYNGGIPVFCDITEDNLNIDPEKIEELITEKTKAIIVVHFGGYACDMDRIMDIAKKNNLYVIEDAAHACGGEYKGKKLGSIGDFGSFSFQAVKNLSTGDGGMLLTNNHEWFERLKKLRWVGISKDTFERGAGNSYDWFYDVTELGFKYHMNDISAAIGLAQLEKLDWMNDVRRKWSNYYRKELRGISQISYPPQKDYMFPACHNFVIKTTKRDELKNFLMKKGITTGVHYYPNHLYDMYEKYSRKLPITESIWKKLITLPLFPGMTQQEANLVIDSIKGFYTI